MSSTPTFTPGNGASWDNGRGGSGTGQIAPDAVRVNLSRQQEYQLGRLIEANIEAAGNGKFKYKEGYNDERITKEGQLIAPVKMHHVIRLRKQLFGELKQPGGKTNPMVVLHTRVNDLLARVEALEAAITNPNK